MRRPRRRVARKRPARVKAPARPRMQARAKAPARPRMRARARAPARPRMRARARAPARRRMRARARAPARPRTRARARAPARPRMRLRLLRPAPRGSRIESLTDDGANGGRTTPHLSVSDSDVVGRWSTPRHSRPVTGVVRDGLVSMSTRHGIAEAWALLRRDVASASEAASDVFPRARCRRRTGAVIPTEPVTMRHRSWSITWSGLALAAGLLVLAQ